MYASFIALTTVATNWVLLALSTALGGLGTADCDRSVGADGTVDKLAVACAPDNLFALLGATTAVVALSVAVFLLSIKRKHVGSFFKPRSYQQDVAEGFSQFPTRARVTLITTRDPVYWPEEAVRDFVAAHWEEWEADPPPAWFADPRWKAALPEKCWPDKETWLAFQRTVVET